VFLVDGAAPLKDACQRHGLDYSYENMGIGTVSNVSFEI
jgi:putative transposase